jgi:26S proteasome regulatory subunit N2
MFATASRSAIVATPTSLTSSTSTNDTATSLIALFRDGIPSDVNDHDMNDTRTRTSSTTPADHLQQIQIYALQQLLHYCLQEQSHEWSLIVTILPDLEALAEEEQGGVLSQLAAAIASHVFFHLEEPNAALRLALLAGPYSPLTTSTTSSSSSSTIGSTTPLMKLSTTPPQDDPYVTTLVRAALDAYIQTRQSAWEKESKVTSSSSATTATATTTTNTMEALTWDVEQLQPMIDTIIDTALATRAPSQYRYAMGICYEARDMTKFQYVVQHAMEHWYENHDDHPNQNDIAPIRALLQYAMKCVMDHTIMVQQNDRTLSQLALTTIASFWQQLYTHPSTNRDDRRSMVYDLVRTYHALKEPVRVAVAIQQLLLRTETTTTTTSSSTTTTTPQQQQEPDHLTALQIAFDLVDTGDQTFCQQVAETLRNERPLSESTSVSHTEHNEVDPTTTTTTTLVPDVWDHVLHVLVGGFVGELILSFRHRHSQADTKIMETVKTNLEDRSSGSHRNSILHTTAIVTHSYLYAGTTNDTFLRNHLDWMKKASHWYVCVCVCSFGCVPIILVSKTNCKFYIVSLSFTGPSSLRRHRWV